MNEAQIKALAESYGRHLLGAALTAILLVGNGASPISFSASQWAEVANALWIALVPVALRYVNKNDAAFGKTPKDFQ
jgi:hypothetical protein